MNSTLSKQHAVMLVDDNEVDNYIAERLLKSFGITNTIFAHTSVASAMMFLKNLDSLKEQPSVIIPEHILLDLNMPISDGFYFLDEFERLSCRLKSQIKITVLTCSLNPSDRERAEKSKYVIDYFTKPLSTENLHKLKKAHVSECCDTEL